MLVVGHMNLVHAEVPPSCAPAAWPKNSMSTPSVKPLDVYSIDHQYLRRLLQRQKPLDVYSIDHQYMRKLLQRTRTFDVYSIEKKKKKKFKLLQNLLILLSLRALLVRNRPNRSMQFSDLPRSTIISYGCTLATCPGPSHYYGTENMHELLRGK